MAILNIGKTHIVYLLQFQISILRSDSVPMFELRYYDKAIQIGKLMHSKHNINTS